MTEVDDVETEEKRQGSIWLRYVVSSFSFPLVLDKFNSFFGRGERETGAPASEAVVAAASAASSTSTPTTTTTTTARRRSRLVKQLQPHLKRGNDTTYNNTTLVEGKRQRKAPSSANRPLTSTATTAAEIIVINPLGDKIKSTEIERDKEGHFRIGFLPVPVEHLETINEVFEKQNKAHKNKMQHVSKSSAKNTIISDDDLDTTIKNKTLLERYTINKNKFYNDIDKKIKSSGHTTNDDGTTDSKGKFKPQVTTHMKTIPDKGYLKLQEPHLDYRMTEQERTGEVVTRLDVSTPEKRRLCKFICFYPISKEGMMIQVWLEQDDDNHNSQLTGYLVYIPYGFCCVLREDVVHAGGLSANIEGELVMPNNNDNDGKFYNNRVHHYVTFESNNNVPKTRSNSSSTRDYLEGNEYYYYCTKDNKAYRFNGKHCHGGEKYLHNPLVLDKYKVSLSETW